MANAKRVGVVLAGCGYLDGAEIEEAVRYANAAAALATTELGAQPSLPTAAEVSVFLRANGEEWGL